jgi:hypothetical protein
LSSSIDGNLTENYLQVTARDLFEMRKSLEVRLASLRSRQAAVVTRVTGGDTSPRWHLSKQGMGGSPSKPLLCKAIDLNVLNDVAKRHDVIAQDSADESGLEEEGAADMRSVRRAPSNANSILLSVDLADALPKKLGGHTDHSSAHRQEISSDINDRILRNLQVSSILRDYGGDTARTDESGRSNFGSEFSSGYAPRSARAVLRTMEQNDKLANQLMETQRALDMTKASLTKQKALNKRLEESSNKRRAELEAFSQVFPRMSFTCTSAVSDTTDPFSDMGKGGGGGLAGEKETKPKNYMTGMHAEEIGQDENLDGGEGRHGEVRGSPVNVAGGLKTFSGELKGNVHVQAPDPSKMFARNDVHDEAQIARVEERDEVKELEQEQEAQFPCTHVAPTKSQNSQK